MNSAIEMIVCNGKLWWTPTKPACVPAGLEEGGVRNIIFFPYPVVPSPSISYSSILIVDSTTKWIKYIQKPTFWDCVPKIMITLFSSKLFYRRRSIYLFPYWHARKAKYNTEVLSKDFFLLERYL
jgi:hypothetical protein